MKRGLFENDFVLAVIAVVAIAALATSAIERQANAAADEKKLAQKQYNALVASQFVAGKCKGDLLKCGNELAALNATARILPFGEENQPSGGNANKVCITRMLSIEKHAEVCAR